MRSWLERFRIRRWFAAAAFASLCAVAPSSIALAQSAPEQLVRFRVQGSFERRVGTVVGMTPDTAHVRIIYAERHGPSFWDLAFYGTQRLFVDPPITVHQPEVLAITRTALTSIERRGDRRVWPFTVLGGTFFGVSGMAAYYGGFTPGTVALHALFTVGGVTLGRAAGRRFGQHRWHAVPASEWDRLPP